MRTSPKGVALIKQFEGLRLAAYPDPATGGDPWTIGYGSTRGVTKGMTITADQAERMLLNDIARFEPQLDALVKVPLKQGQWDALMSFVYNLGAANLESSTLLKLLNAGDYAAAGDQFARWNKAAGKIMAGLTARRAAERAMFLGAA
jgi:lysozyme